MVVHTIADKDRICALDFAIRNTEQDGLLASGLTTGAYREAPSILGKKKQTLEAICVLLSAVCLMALGIWRALPNGKDLEVRLSRETLLFSRDPSVIESMRLFHSKWNNNCSDYKLLLQTPTWPAEGQNETGKVMHGSIESITVPIFHIAWPVFLFALIFQTWRWLKYDITYNPQKGPEFSRWLEYFFTSPLQILVVSTSFGFATLDSLLGQCGMQAALVLLGYDIEQQVKKIYKRKKVFATKKGRFQHVFSPGIPDLRVFVYLLFSWVLHFIIWGLPGVPGVGIGGKYAQLQAQIDTCGQGAIPEAVTVIYWFQYILFTLFGVVCTWQVVGAFRSGQQLDKEAEWEKVSYRYTILSVTAKTLLAIGLVAYVMVYKPWILEPTARTQEYAVNNKRCLSLS